MKTKMKIEKCPCINCLCVAICKGAPTFDILMNRCSLVSKYLNAGIRNLTYIPTEPYIERLNIVRRAIYGN